jgi:hypothetical protein
MERRTKSLYNWCFLQYSGMIRSDFSQKNSLLRRAGIHFLSQNGPRQNNNDRRLLSENLVVVQPQVFSVLPGNSIYLGVTGTEPVAGMIER